MYQTDKPMFPFLYSDLKLVFLKLLELIVRPEILENVKVDWILKTLTYIHQKILKKIISELGMLQQQ